MSRCFKANGVRRFTVGWASLSRGEGELRKLPYAESEPAGRTYGLYRSSDPHRETRGAISKLTRRSGLFGSGALPCVQVHFTVRIAPCDLDRVRLQARGLTGLAQRDYP